MLLEGGGEGFAAQDARAGARVYAALVRRHSIRGGGGEAHAILNSRLCDGNRTIRKCVDGRMRAILEVYVMRAPQYPPR